MAILRWSKLHPYLVQAQELVNSSGHPENAKETRESIEKFLKAFNFDPRELVNIYPLLTGYIFNMASVPNLRRELLSISSGRPNFERCLELYQACGYVHLGSLIPLVPLEALNDPTWDQEASSSSFQPSDIDWELFGITHHATASRERELMRHNPHLIARRDQLVASTIGPNPFPEARSISEATRTIHVFTQCIVPQLILKEALEKGSAVHLSNRELSFFRAVVVLVNALHRPILPRWVLERMGF
jgi:hypothetical protein